MQGRYERQVYMGRDLRELDCILEDCECSKYAVNPGMDNLQAHSYVDSEDLDSF